MLGSELAEFHKKRRIAAADRLKARRRLSNRLETTCESAFSGFDANACDDYVMRS
jgi:hypothetical protein